MMTAHRTVHDEVIGISREYLGPATERFIDRQIVTHLKKDPMELTCQDLPRLVDWIKLAFALLTKDSELVDEYVSKLLALSGGRPSAYKK